MLHNFNSSHTKMRFLGSNHFINDNFLNQEKDVGVKGLRKCEKELKAYEKCMNNDKKWKRVTSYRVSRTHCRALM